MNFTKTYNTMENTFKIDDEVWYPIKNWEHLYAISENGQIARIRNGVNCKPIVLRYVGNYNARNVVFTETIQGKKIEKAYQKSTLAFDTFYPNKRGKKTVSFKDGDYDNLSKNNLVISNKNSTNFKILLNSINLGKAKKLRREGKTIKAIKKEMNLDFSEETLRKILK